MLSKRGHVWLAAGAVVETEDGRLLVVKKKYGGLKGKWSFPAGFVEPGETLDEAALRELREETGITGVVEGCLAIRTGVIQGKIGDHLILFRVYPDTTDIVVEKSELEDAQFLTKAQLAVDPDASLLVVRALKEGWGTALRDLHSADPGAQFGYTSYKVAVDRHGEITKN
ncbi:NUDIX domain-containing protein [Bacillus fonticola]|uniref:NUDIX domain-containing protein n=1 Tax=Bacillus fonticola TaxID=2728853 RepID=UPI001474E860|nr:NUDIX hydrolase [Bacillus fonticola]